MKPESQIAYESFEGALNALVKIYRHLLGIVRREREILIAANLDDLTENNRTKEAMLIRAGQLEEQRIRFAGELAQLEGLPAASRLMDFANHLGGDHSARLRRLHSVLELLLNRVKEHNLQNEGLVQAALNNIHGAMGSIRNSLADKPTYKKSGGIATRATEPGQLVRKEV